MAVRRAALLEAARFEVRGLARVDDEQIEEADGAAQDDAGQRAEQPDATRRRQRALRGREAGRREAESLGEAVERRTVVDQQLLRPVVGACPPETEFRV